MEQVTCQECGAKMSYINNRHLQSHGFTAAEYKIKFPNSPMKTEAISKKLSDRSIKSNDLRKGVPRSEETKRKMRAGLKRINYKPRSGWIMTDEQKEKLSKAANKRFEENGSKLKGIPKTEETKQKISETLTGRTLSDSHLENLREALSKRLNPFSFDGYTHSQESRDKISQSTKNRFARERETTREYMLERIAQSNLVLLNNLSDTIFQLHCIICNHSFMRTPQCFHSSKWKAEMCDQCYPKSIVSIAETEIANYVKTLTSEIVITSDRHIIKPLELDIFVPSLNIAIEYCGIYWHSELLGKDKLYHRNKLELCRSLNIKLLTIFEDEWLFKKDLVKSMIRNAFNCNSLKIPARKTIVKELDTKNTSKFLQENHIQGAGRSNVKFGLFYCNQLISVMTFSKSEMSRRSVGWDMNRFCSKQGYNIQGGASKLFKAFVDQYNPDQVISYADLRWGTGNTYKHLGFHYEGDTVANYWYFKEGTIERYHRFGLRKKANEPKEITEWEIRQDEGWNRIWDCGSAKWVYTKPK